MTRKWRLAALAILGMFAAQMAARAEDTYSIKLKENATGDVIAVENASTSTFDSDFEDGTGKPGKASTQKSGQSLVYTETILAQEAGKSATQLSRHYDKAELQRGDQTVTPSYQGKTLVIAKNEGKYHFQVEKEELTGVDATGFEREFNHYPEEERHGVTRLCLPGKPVALNESWMIDMAPVVKHLKKMTPFDTDSDKVKGTGILRKVYTKNNRLYGVLHFDIEIPAKSFGEGARKLVMDDGFRITAAADVDACIDGSVEDETLKLDMKMVGSASKQFTDGSKGKLTILIHNNGTTSRIEQPKK